MNTEKMMRTLILILIINKINAARILVFVPTPSISHQQAFWPLNEELAKQHEVVYITTNPAKSYKIKNLTEIDIRKDAYSIIRIGKRPRFFGRHNFTYTGLKYLSNQVFVNAFNNIMNSDKVENIMKDKFDLIIVEASVRPAMGWSHIFKVPVIKMSSYGGLTDNYDCIGVKVNSLLHGTGLDQRIYELDLFEKYNKLYKLYYLYKLYASIEYEHDVMNKRHFGIDAPSLNELHKNVNMLFLNVPSIWDNCLPVPLGLVYTTGMHAIIQEEMSEDMKSLLNSSKKGIIYMSLGTNAFTQELPELMGIFLNVFPKLPYQILLKWDSNETPLLPQNVITAKWFPQNQILSHPNVKLFITQGGLNSLMEAISFGVPTIGIPLIVDQWYNMENVVRHRCGILLDEDTVTEEVLTEAVLRIMRNDSYSANCRAHAKIIHDVPLPPLQRAVWWINHLLHHGGAHITSPAANLPWTDYYEVELIFLVISILMTTTTLVLCGAVKIQIFLCKYYLSSSTS